MALTKKRKGLIYESLQNLNKKDTMSLLLFSLYKLKDDPQYGALSELCYVLDGDNLSKFLSYYGGMTLKIPTLREFRLIIKALQVFQFTNIESEYSLDEALIVCAGNEFSKEELSQAYLKIVEVTKQYTFDRPED